ncbi:hypothetical protein ACFLZH_03765 [Patescibacteria group bacterium]
MKNSKWLTAAGLAAVFAFTTVFSVAMADEGFAPEDKPDRPQMEELKAAIASGDYNAFAEIAPEKMLEQINADNFGRFVEMHEHLEAARQIAEELGLEKMGKMHQKGQMKGKMKGQMKETQKEMRAAIENNDYNAFAEVAPEKMLEFINADNFHLLVELHEAKESGDFERAKELAAEIGFPEKPEGFEKPGAGQGNGFGNRPF